MVGCMIGSRFQVSELVLKFPELFSAKGLQVSGSSLYTSDDTLSSRHSVVW